MVSATSLYLQRQFLLIEELSLPLFEARKRFDVGKPHGYGLPVDGAGSAMQGSAAKTLAAGPFCSMTSTVATPYFAHFLPLLIGGYGVLILQKEALPISLLKAVRL